MWHRIAFVAEHRHVDETAFVPFATENAGTFSVLGTGREAEVNTWHVDAFFAGGGSRLSLDDWKRRYGYGSVAVQ